jgi:isopenicillin N synthase-like dioxygenase
VGATPEFA